MRNVRFELRRDDARDMAVIEPDGGNAEPARGSPHEPGYGVRAADLDDVRPLAFDDRAYPPRREHRTVGLLARNVGHANLVAPDRAVVGDGITGAGHDDDLPQVPAIGYEG